MNIHSALRRVAALIALAMVAVGLTACAPGDQKPTGERITIGLTYTPNIQFAPFYVAAARGYFAEAGIDVELRHHGESEDLFGALQQGTEQLVYAGGDEVVQARSAGIDVTSVATLYDSYPAALIVPDASPIRTAADMRGRTIGVPGPYGQTYTALRAMLASAGLTEADVNIQHIGYTQQAALTAGRVEGVMGFVNNDAVQIQRSGFAVRTIPASDGGEASLVGPVVAASAQALKEKTAVISAVLGAVNRATNDIVRDPASALDDAAEYVPTLRGGETREAALATLEATVPLIQPPAGRGFRQDEAVWQRMTVLLEREGLMTGPAPTVGESMTNDVLPGAEQADG